MTLGTFRLASEWVPGSDMAQFGNNFICIRKACSAGDGGENSSKDFFSSSFNSFVLCFSPHFNGFYMYISL